MHVGAVTYTDNTPDILQLNREGQTQQGYGAVRDD